MRRRGTVTKPILLLAIIIALAVASLAIFGSLSPSDSSTTDTVVTCPSPSSPPCSGPPPVLTSGTSTSSGATSSSADSPEALIFPEGTTYQVQSSYDCVAGNSQEPFNVTGSSLLQGGISTGAPGVTVYVATTQQAGSITMGHPSNWVYSSGLTNKTTFSVPLNPGSYVFWTEGADLGCGATVVTPLELITTVNVTQAVLLAPH